MLYMHMLMWSKQIIRSEYNYVLKSCRGDSVANDLAHRFTAADVILQLNQKIRDPEIE